ncbi:MAG: ANTAR domain-containing protein [Peptococcaceae bacterium]|jgi:response regulator NasT|nr:ANTAR domain-containing protein [Peptococcaceae bacterium]
MERALVITRSRKGVEFFSEMLKAVSCATIVPVPTGGKARRLLLDRDFDICIINGPLQDEPGEDLARHVASRGITQVILMTPSSYYEEITALVENSGVMTVAKPVNEKLFWSALKMAYATHKKMQRLQTENTKLVRKIEDIRLVDRAKCILISHMGMTEPQAHKYIEKQAMDMRMTRRLVAEGILKTYE